MAQPTAAARTSRTQDTYERLRAAIITGRLRPNERLVEAELAERLEVSRTPVRECLHRLASEGLVTNRRRGWVVHEHTPDEIRDVYDLRAALEGFAARLAAERATPEQTATMEQLAAVDPATYADPPRTDLVDYNQTFHDTVVIAAGSARLAETIRRSREYYFNHRIAAVYTPADVAAALAGHRAIAAAVKGHDADAAERLTRAHVYEALELAVHKL